MKIVTYDLLPADLKAIREEVGDTQQAWAERLGVSLDTVKSWESESGRSIPSYQLQIEISQIAGVEFRISAEKKHPAYKARR